LLAGLLLLAAAMPAAPMLERPAAPAALARWLALPQEGEGDRARRALLAGEPVEAEPRLRALAAAGEDWAALNLGLLALEAGRREDALTLLRQAAERGNRPAQHYLARLLAEPAGERASLIEAYVWSGLAARAGNAAAERLNGGLRRQLSEAERSQGNERIWHWRPR
jgi:TPR repeat protein